VYGAVQEVFAMVHRLRRDSALASAGAGRFGPLAAHGGGRSRGARGRLLLFLALALLLSPLVFPAAAQSGVERDVKIELQRTDRVIERAADEIRDAVNVFSNQQLLTARDLQRRAWREFRETPPALKLAFGLTLKARKSALKAIEAARIEKRAGENVRRAVDRAQERIAEIGERVEQSGNPLARRIFDQGVDQIRRATRAYRAGNLQQASRLAGLALSLIERSDRIAAEQITASTAAQTSLERTEALLAEVEALLRERGFPRAEAGALAEARRFLDRARESFRKGQLSNALRLSLRARRKALDLLTKLREAPRPEDLSATLDDLAALAAEMAPEIASGGSKAAARRFAEAEELLGEARHLLHEGKTKEALRILVAAETLLREAAEAIRRR
jgi:hypothetical protein